VLTKINQRFFSWLSKSKHPNKTSTKQSYVCREEEMSTPLVVLEYEDLLSDKDLSEEILRAYGAGSLGALGVRGIPNLV